MKKGFSLLLFVSLFLSRVFPSFSQPGEWVWIRGTNILNSPGNFGAQGVTSPFNDPPGLYEACEWKDLNGNFWLYGGSGLGGSSHNDLWKYDPVINQWTWMTGTNTPGDTGNYGTQGVAALTNRPPALALGVVSWVDTAGNFWMFGGNNSGGYSDLWKYDPLSNLWTWMKGPGVKSQIGIYGTLGVPAMTNNPGSRWEVATGWTDDVGNLWLFGGSGNFNDLWRYNIATNMWTWMKGSNATGGVGVYGTQGVEDSLNCPGARSCYSRWKDKFGNFWMYGGYDFSNHTFSDLWRFNPHTNNWTWMNGSNIANVNGVYGSRCVPTSANMPGARMENRAAWTDPNRGFWMFGGYISGRSFNDLWMYCSVTNQWVWVSGDSTANSAGNWGREGVSSPLNKPNGRYGSISWRDNNGHLYFFGGHGGYNDLWKYTIDTTCSYCAGGPPVADFQTDTSICTGDCINIIDHSASMPTSYQWLFPGGTPSSSTFSNPIVCYNSAGVYDVTLIESNIYGSDTLTRSNYVGVYNPGGLPAVFQSGDTVYAPQGYITYQWYFSNAPISGATNYFYVASQSGQYSLDVKDIHGCHIFVQFIDVIITGVSTFSKDASSSLIVFPNPSNGNFNVVISSLVLSPVTIQLMNPLGEIVYSSKENLTEGRTVISVRTGPLSPGTYSLEVASDNGHLHREIFIQK